VNRLFALAVLLLAVLVAPRAYAQDDARTHFNEGMKLLGKGDYDGACAAFEKSEKAGKPTMATSYQLGRCNEGRDKFGLAHEHYLRAAQLGDESGDPERATIARQRAQEVGAKAPKLIIVVTAERRADRMRIELDGEALDEEDWGKPLPVAERPHRLVVSAPGKKSATMQLPAPDTGKSVRVEVPKLSPGSGSTAVEAPAPSTQPGPRPAPAPPPPGAIPPPMGPGYELERRSPGLFGLGITFVCVGGVGILVGGIWAGGSATFDGEPHPGSIVTLVGGVALLGTGIPLIVIYGKKVPPEQPTAAVTVEPLIGAGSGGVRVTF
jgi:hypothetical protein